MFGQADETSQRETMPLPPSKPVCLRQGVRALDDGELPRATGYCGERNSVQLITPRRGETFVTRKITPPRRGPHSLVGQQDKLQFGKSDARATGGSPRNTLRIDVVDAATGSARRLCHRHWYALCARVLDEAFGHVSNRHCRVEIDQRLPVPPTPTSCGRRQRKARRQLGWTPLPTFRERLV